jgi:hypothetical protein
MTITLESKAMGGGGGGGCHIEHPGSVTYQCDFRHLPEPHFFPSVKFRLKKNFDQTL